MLIRKAFIALLGVVACSSLQAEKQPEIFSHFEVRGEGITKKIEKEIVVAIQRFVEALESGQLGEFEFEFALSKDELAVLEEAVAKSNLPQDLKEILQHILAMGWFGRGKGGQRSCEGEGRQSAKEICPKEDHKCKERVYEKTTERCYKHRGGKDGSGKPPEVEGGKE